MNNFNAVKRIGEFLTALMTELKMFRLRDFDFDLLAGQTDRSKSLIHDFAWATATEANINLSYPLAYENDIPPALLFDFSGFDKVDKRISEQKVVRPKRAGGCEIELKKIQSGLTRQASLKKLIEDGYVPISRYEFFLFAKSVEFPVDTSVICLEEVDGELPFISFLSKKKIIGLCMYEKLLTSNDYFVAVKRLTLDSLGDILICPSCESDNFVINHGAGHYYIKCSACKIHTHSAYTASDAVADWLEGFIQLSSDCPYCCGDDKDACGCN